jgi:hypothetical protein
MLNRTSLLLRIASLVFVSATPTLAAHHAGDARPAWHEPKITFVDQPTPKDEATIAWAVDTFREARLQLPDLEISFPASCGRKMALYHPGRQSIEFCRVNKQRVVHEFAHAWDDTSGAVDRQAFLAMRGLEVWWGGVEMPSDQQGAEHLAKIITWGLMGFEPRDIPQLPHNSERELRAAYALLTQG